MIDPLSSGMGQQMMSQITKGGMGPGMGNIGKDMFRDIADKEVNKLNKAEPSAFSGPNHVRVDSKDGFGSMIGDLIKDVNEKGKIARAETNKLLLGETDNIHQSMIAMQESGLAFTLLVEVRNKLVQSYQELMKMPV